VLGIFGGVELADPLKVGLITIGLIIFFLWVCLRILRISKDSSEYIYMYEKRTIVPTVKKGEEEKRSIEELRYC